MDILIEQCDILVCHGSHTIVMQALLKGKPVLALPGMFEHELTARRLNDNKLGLISTPGSLELHPRRQLEKLLTEKIFKNECIKFMNKYAKEKLSTNIDNICNKIIAL